MGTHPIFESDFDCLTEMKKSRSQGVRQREKAASEGAFTSLFTEYRNELDTKNDTQEQIYKCARDVIIESKRVIFTLQRCARSEEWDVILSEACTRMHEIKTKIVQIRRHLTQWDQHIFQRAYDFGIEEFIEAIGFYWFLKFGCMPSQAEIENEINLKEDGVDNMTIDSTVYVFGLADVAGEIMRFTTSTIDPAVAAKSVKFMRDLSDCYVSLRDKGLIYRTKNMSQKVNTMMSSLTKIEHLCYRMTIRRLEFGEENEQMMKEMLRRDLNAKSVDPGFSEE